MVIKFVTIKLNNLKINLTLVLRYSTWMEKVENVNNKEITKP